MRAEALAENARRCLEREAQAQADIIYNELKLYSNHFRYCWLSKKHDKKKSAISEKWKLYINTEIEPDEI